MGERFEFKKEELQRVKEALLRTLQEEEKILFAYLHGSFDVSPIRDIDIRAYCHVSENEAFDFEMEMSSKLELVSGYRVDFKVINYAPLGFQFSVLNEGTLLFERDRAVRLDFLEETGFKYMDYFEFSKSYFKELKECIER